MQVVRITDASTKHVLQFQYAGRNILDHLPGLTRTCVGPVSSRFPHSLAPGGVGGYSGWELDEQVRPAAVKTSPWLDIWSCCVAAAMVRRASASMARVTHRCQAVQVRT
jgi:hypothetical protein